MIPKTKYLDVIEFLFLVLDKFLRGPNPKMGGLDWCAPLRDPEQILHGMTK